MIVYKYGCRAPSHRDISIIRDQLFRANRYRNNLIQLELARRAARDFGSSPEEIKQARSVESRALRAALLDDRGALGSGTYLLVEADVKRASRTATPRFRPFSGTGRIGATIPTARSQKPIVGTWSGAFRLEHKCGKFYIAHMSLGRGYKIAIPVKIHRPLPTGEPIIGCTLQVERIGDRWTYSICVTIDAEQSTKPTGSGTCAINFGWRRLPCGGVRVATCLDKDGNELSLVLPSVLLSKRQHCETLKSLGDRYAQLFLGDSRRRSRKRREFILNAAYGVKHTELSREQFCSTLAKKDSSLDQEHWARRDRHLYQWERDEENRALNQRRELYRLWAREIAKRYASVTVEAFNLRNVLERSTFTDLPAGDRAFAERANHIRYLVGPSYLRSEIKAVFGEACKLSTERPKTQKCHECGEKCTFDAARHLTHICEHCGAHWDQDINNAANQLAETAAA